MPTTRKRTTESTSAIRRRLLLFASVVVIVAVMLLRPRPGGGDSDRPGTAQRETPESPPSAAAATSPRLAEAQAIVARRLSAFTSERRALAGQIARRYGSTPPAEVDAFFAAVAARRWTEVDVLFHSLAETFGGRSDSESGQPIFAPVYETYCVADLVQTWPADRLLEAGYAVLSSSGSATAYVCRTDTNLWLATLVNDARGPGRKILISQSLLSDPAYAEYLRFLYPEQMIPLSSQDMSRARQAGAMGSAYASSSAEEAPADGVNERINRELLRTLANMNPHLTFAREEPPPSTN